MEEYHENHWLGSLGGVFSGLRLVNFSSLTRYIISRITVGASTAILMLEILPSVCEEVVKPPELSFKLALQ